MPAYDDIFRDEDDEDGGDSGNESEDGSEPSGKRRRYDEVRDGGKKNTQKNLFRVVVRLSLMLCHPVLTRQGAVERRIERQREKREWEARR